MQHYIVAKGECNDIRISIVILVINIRERKV
jgi:hypothetical protein